jgi:hypothetical protein
VKTISKNLLKKRSISQTRNIIIMIKIKIINNQKSNSQMEAAVEVELIVNINLQARIMEDLLQIMTNHCTQSIIK